MRSTGRLWRRSRGVLGGRRPPWAAPQPPQEGSEAITVPQILIHHDGELLAKAVAARLVTRLVDAVAAKGLAELVLTGGGIGTQILAELGAAPARDAVDCRPRESSWADKPLLPTPHPTRPHTHP